MPKTPYLENRWSLAKGESVKVSLHSNGIKTCPSAAQYNGWTKQARTRPYTHNHHSPLHSQPPHAPSPNCIKMFLLLTFCPADTLYSRPVLFPSHSTSKNTFISQHAAYALRYNRPLHSTVSKEDQGSVPTLNNFFYEQVAGLTQPSTQLPQRTFPHHPSGNTHCPTSCGPHIQQYQTGLIRSSLHPTTSKSILTTCTYSAADCPSTQQSQSVPPP